MRYRVRQNGWLADLVWISTHESRAAGLISILAVAEVILAVAAAWALYATTGWAYHLLTSVIAIPFVLLRSEASVDRAHRMWKSWETPSRPRHSTPKFILALSCQIIAMILVGVLTAKVLGAPGTFFSAALLVSMAILFGAALSVAVDRTAFGGYIISIFDSNLLAWSIAIASCIAGIAAITTIRGGELGTLWSLVLLPIGAIMFFTGVAIGGGAAFLLSGLLIRLISALSHPIQGIRELPRNWHRITLTTDSAMAPELVPGIAQLNSQSSFEARLEQIRSHDAQQNYLHAVFLLIWALPTFFYRFSLKSTVWLYVPILLTRIPAGLHDAEGRTTFLAQQNRTWWEWFQIVAAVGALAYAAFFAVDWAAVQALNEVRTGDVPITPYHVLLVLDLGRLPWWNWVSVPAALLTVMLFLWVDIARKRQTEPMSVQITMLLLTMNLRNWLAYGWCFVALYAVIGDAYRLCLLPDGFAALLDWHFGPLVCQDAAHG